MTSLAPVPVADHHPVVWFARRAHQVLDEVLAGGVHVATLSASVTAEAVVELARLEARVAALRASLLPHAETVQVAAEATPVATSTGAWLAHATTTPPGQARRTVMLAQRLDTVYEATREAALDGRADPGRGDDHRAGRPAGLGHHRATGRRRGAPDRTRRHP